MRLVQPRDELFDSVNRVEALGIGIRDGPAVDHLVLRVEPQLHDLKGHLSLPALRKEAPYTGGYGASKIQLLTGSDGEEGTLHFGASIALWGLDTRLTLLAPSQQ